MRAFAEEAYGIPREQVIGSSVKLRYDLRDNRVSLAKLPELNSFDDREVKALNIGLHIGRRPLLAFGNSDGDLAMMRYTKSGSGPRLALLLHHDDASPGGSLRPRIQAEPVVRGARQGSGLRHHRREHEAGLERCVLIAAMTEPAFADQTRPTFPVLKYSTNRNAARCASLRFSKRSISFSTNSKVNP